MNSGNLMRVLLVEDDPGDARLIQAMLPETDSAKFEFTRTASLSEAIVSLNHAPADIVLLDLDLPDSKGLETVDSLCRVAPDVPVVVLTCFHVCFAMRWSVKEPKAGCESPSIFCAPRLKPCRF